MSGVLARLCVFIAISSTTLRVVLFIVARVGGLTVVINVSMLLEVFLAHTVTVLIVHPSARITLVAFVVVVIGLADVLNSLVFIVVGHIVETSVPINHQADLKVRTCVPSNLYFQGNYLCYRAPRHPLWGHAGAYFRLNPPGVRSLSKVHTSIGLARFVMECMEHPIAPPYSPV